MKLPSQRLFLIAIPAIVLIGLFVTFYKPAHKGGGTEQSVKTVAVKNNIVNEVDTDGDGVPDWKEVIWKTDPNKAATYNGIPDKDYIAEQSSKGGTLAGVSTSITNTEELTQELFNEYMSMKQSGQFNASTANMLASRITQSIQAQPLDTPYDVSQLKTFPDSDSAKVQKYADDFQNIYNRYLNAYQNQNHSNLLLSDPNFKSSLNSVSDFYLKYSKELMALEVPSGAAKYHLNYANALKESAQGLIEFSDTNVEPLKGYIGFQRHLDGQDNQQVEIGNLTNFLNNRGIINFSIDIL